MHHGVDPPRVEESGVLLTVASLGRSRMGEVALEHLSMSRLGLIYFFPKLRQIQATHHILHPDISAKVF